MNTLQKHVSSWRPAFLLLRLRFRTGFARLSRSPALQISLLAALFLVGSASLVLGQGNRTEWTTLPPVQATIALQQNLLTAQIFWIMLLLFPGSFALVGKGLSAADLRAFPLRPAHLCGAEVAGRLFDFPTLLFLPVFFPLLSFLFLQSPGTALVAVGGFVLFGVQTVTLAYGLEKGITVALRTLGRHVGVPLLVCVFLLLSYYGLMRSLGSVLRTPKGTGYTTDWQHPPHYAANALLDWLPSGQTAHLLAHARDENYPALAGTLFALSGTLVLTIGGTLAMQKRQAVLATNSSGKKVSVWKMPLVFPDRSASAWTQVETAARLEWRHLTRNPLSHLPLRGPANLLFFGCLLWILPDTGPPGQYGIYNLHELLLLGPLLYLVLWQVQLLCNRFGNEADGAALLFTFSIPRWRLILGRNLALLTLLTLVDSLALAMLNAASGANGLRVSLPETVIYLLLLTSIGNICSLMLPFPLTAVKNEPRQEPERSLALLYIGVGVLTGILLIPMREGFANGIMSGLGAFCLVLAFYAVSLFVSAQILARQEPELIGSLTGR